MMDSGQAHSSPDVSTGSSPSRDSAVDADTTLQRKRPRLSSSTTTSVGDNVRTTREATISGSDSLRVPSASPPQASSEVRFTPPPNTPATSTSVNSDHSAPEDFLRFFGMHHMSHAAAITYITSGLTDERQVLDLHNRVLLWTAAHVAKLSDEDLSHDVVFWQQHILLIRHISREPGRKLLLGEDATQHLGSFSAIVRICRAHLRLSLLQYQPNTNRKDSMDATTDVLSQAQCADAINFLLAAILGSLSPVPAHIHDGDKELLMSESMCLMCNFAADEQAVSGLFAIATPPPEKHSKLVWNLELMHTCVLLAEFLVKAADTGVIKDRLLVHVTDLAHTLDKDFGRFFQLVKDDVSACGRLSNIVKQLAIMCQETYALSAGTADSRIGSIYRALLVCDTTKESLAFLRKLDGAGWVTPGLCGIAAQLRLLARCLELGKNEAQLVGPRCIDVVVEVIEYSSRDTHGQDLVTDIIARALAISDYVSLLLDCSRGKAQIDKLRPVFMLMAQHGHISIREINTIWNRATSPGLEDIATAYTEILCAFVNGPFQPQQYIAVLDLVSRTAIDKMPTSAIPLVASCFSALVKEDQFEQIQELLPALVQTCLDMAFQRGQTWSKSEVETLLRCLQFVVRPNCPMPDLVLVLRKCMNHLEHHLDLADLAANILFDLIERNEYKVRRAVPPLDIVKAVHASFELARKAQSSTIALDGRVWRQYLLARTISMTSTADTPSAAELLWACMYGKSAPTNTRDSEALTLVVLDAMRTNVTVDEVFRKAMELPSNSITDERLNRASIQVFDYLLSTPQKSTPAGYQSLVTNALIAARVTSDAEVRSKLEATILRICFNAFWKGKNYFELGKLVQQQIANRTAALAIYGDPSAPHFLASAMNVAERDGLRETVSPVTVRKRSFVSKPTSSFELTVHFYGLNGLTQAEEWLLPASITLGEFSSTLQQWSTEVDSTHIIWYGRLIPLDEASKRLLRDVVDDTRSSVVQLQLCGDLLKGGDTESDRTGMTVFQATVEHYYKDLLRLMRKDDLVVPIAYVLHQPLFESPLYRLLLIEACYALEDGADISAARIRASCSIIDHFPARMRCESPRDDISTVVNALADWIARNDITNHVELMCRIATSLRIWLLELDATDSETAIRMSTTELLKVLITKLSAVVALPMSTFYVEACAYALHLCILELVSLSQSAWTELNADPGLQRFFWNVIEGPAVHVVRAVVSSIGVACSGLEAQIAQLSSSLEGNSPTGAQHRSRCISIINECHQRLHRHALYDRASEANAAQYLTGLAEVAGAVKYMQDDIALSGMRDTFNTLCSIIPVDRTHPHASNLLSNISNILTVYNKDAQRRILRMTPSKIAKLFWPYLFNSSSRLEESCVMSSAVCRESVFDLLKSSSVDEGEAHTLLVLMSETIDALNIDESVVLSRRPIIRLDDAPVGLDNLAMTCYVNSLVQTLFANSLFRRFILELSCEDEEKQPVLMELQKTFVCLEQSELASYRPERLVEALGVDPLQQEDVHLFFTMLHSRLEDELPTAEAKAVLKSIFTGQERSQTKGSCGHISESTDEFINLSLTVKGRSNLVESLEEYVAGYELDDSNRFECSACKEAGNESMVKAYRRTGMERLPDHLSIGLKRFQYDMLGGSTKVNDEFAFPDIVDMAPFKLDPGQESDMFGLTSVIVHRGVLSHGHYWAYVKLDAIDEQSQSSWWRIEDSVAYKVDVEHVLKETRATPFIDANGYLEERSDNAYVLFYRRLSAESPGLAQTRSDVVAGAGSYVQEENINILQASRLLEPSCQRFILDLVLTISHSTRGAVPLDGESDKSSSTIFTRKAAQMLHAYLLKLGGIDRRPDACMTFCNEIIFAMEINPPLAAHLLELIFEVDKDPKHSVLLIPSRSARLAINTLITAATNIAETHGQYTYGNVRSKNPDESTSYINFIRIIETLHNVISYAQDNMDFWITLFPLLHRLAQKGRMEASTVATIDFVDLALKCMFYPPNEPGKWDEPTRGQCLAYNHVLEFLAFAFAELVSGNRIPGRLDALRSDLTSKQKSSMLAQTKDIPSVFCRLVSTRCSLDGENITVLPHSRLLTYLVAGSYAPGLDKAIIEDLCAGLDGTGDGPPFERVFGPALTITLCPESTVAQREMLCRAVLVESGSHSDFTEASIKFLALTIHLVPGVLQVETHTWICDAFATDVEHMRYETRSDLLNFLQVHVYQLGKENPDEHADMLQDVVRGDGFLINLVSDLVQEAFRARASKTGYRRHLVAACLDGCQTLLDRWDEYVSDSFQDTRVEKQLRANGYQPCDLSALVRKIWQIRNLKRSCLKMAQVAEEDEIKYQRLVKKWPVDEASDPASVAINRLMQDVDDDDDCYEEEEEDDDRSSDLSLHDADAYEGATTS